MTDSYKTLASTTVYNSKVFTVKTETISLPNGKTAERFTVEHPGASVILPQANSGELLLVRQYRHAIGRQILEFPAGTLEQAEDPMECAKREIVEEIGFAASKWTSLGSILPAPGFCSELQHLFFAEELTEAYAEADDDEFIEVISMSVQAVEEAILVGEISDAKSIAAFSRARFRGLL